MHVVLIINPTSGSSNMISEQSTIPKHEETILASLRALHIEPEVWYTTETDSGYKQAKQAAMAGADIVIAAGGDGTLHAVASGLVGTQSALGIIATGTMNNIAHSLEIPEEIPEACKTIAYGETSKIDIGKVNEHIFLEVAGIGLEAALFPAAEEIKRAGLLSTIKGVFDGLRTLLAFQTTRVRISFDNQRVRYYNSLQVSVCNSPYYGAHFQFAPDAVMDDGLLDVLIYKNFSKVEFLRHAIAISQGRRILEPKVIRSKVRSLYIEAVTPTDLHADGVPIGKTPARITVIPGSLLVRVPQKVATSPHISLAKQHGAQSSKDTMLEAKGSSYAQ